MKHYFSRHLISHYWYGDETTRRLCTIIARTHNLYSTKVSKEYLKTWSLKAWQYLSIPQLISLEFWSAMKREFPTRNMENRRRALNNALKKLQDLPEDGWDINQFTIDVIHIKRSTNLVVVMGMAYEVIPLSYWSPYREKQATILTYKGADLITKLKKIQKMSMVFGQLTNDGVFWHIRSWLERKKLVNWRKIRNLYKGPKL